jgi:hypothetical protein
MRRLALAVSLALASITSANATGAVEVEYGQCRFSSAQDGTFYDSTMSPHLYLTPRCGEIAYSRKFRGSPWGWRVGLIATGSVESRESLASMNDNIPHDAPCSNEDWANCHSYFSGEGRMRGLTLSITREVRLNAKWWTEGEVGVLFFHDYFNSYVKPADFKAVSPIGGTSERWEGKADSGSPGYPVPRVGARVGYGPAYVAARYHFTPGTLGAPGHWGESVTNHAFLELTVGLRIDLK